MLSITKELNTPEFQLQNTYIDQLRSLRPGFFSIMDQDDELDRMESWVQSNSIRLQSYETIIVIGIGGSMLGPQSLYAALQTAESPKFQFVDNIDPDLVNQVCNSMNPDKTLVIVQSKSGMTPETLALYFVFRRLMEEHTNNWSEHFVFVTDPVSGHLRETALQYNITTFDIPSEIGGRFSVLTPIGLLIAELCGWSYKPFISGAKDMFDREMNSGSQSLLLAQSSAILYQEGVNISVLMPYSSRLRLLSEWYTQLLSESIGKINSNGESVGITPLASLGSTDQHSKLQLFQDGPKDKLVIFLEVNEFDSKVAINPIHTSDFAYMNGNSLNDLIKAELHATRESLAEVGRPSYTLSIDKITPYELGAIYMFFQCMIGFMGLIFEVDAYNQPGVERSKILTKDFLLKHS